MKEQKAMLNYLRMAPRKVRLVADSIRGLSVNEAEAKLSLKPKRASLPLIKLLHSAVANAKHNQQLDAGRLFVKEIRVDQGPTLKRFMPRAMGRTTPIHKKSSHIILVLAESEKLKESRFKITKPERIKKRELERIKKERMEQKQSEQQKEIKETKKTKGPGFMKRVFRRKSIG